MSTTKTAEQNHAEQNAKAWVESMVEMVAKLERESAAQFYASQLTREQCEKILGEDCDFGDQWAKDTIAENDDEGLREGVADMIDSEVYVPDDFEFDEEAAREEIQDSPLSVQVRSGWGDPGAEMQPEEFEILLSTGGPALRIRGELDEHKQPDRAYLEHQDWGTPWTQYFGVEQSTLLAFCRCLYFGD